MVATRCFTYNQAPYIKDALRGFAMQETTFPSVYMVIDDASTDDEQDVLKKWAAEHLMIGGDSEELWKSKPYGQLAVAPLRGKPQSLFVLLLLAENHYRTGKSLKRFEYISEWLDDSKYHAICEGDDYWTDARKLQMQVDYLEANKTCALVHSKAQVFDDSSKVLTSQIKGQAFGSFFELLRSNKVVTLTVCIRSSAFFEYFKQSLTWPEKKDWKMGDYPCWLWLSYYYDVHFMDKVTGVYRLLPESSSHSSTINRTLEFHKSGFQIQMFFSNLFAVDPETKSNLYNNHIKDRVRVCCQYGLYRDAYAEAKLLPLKDKLKFSFLVFLRSMWK